MNQYAFRRWNRWGGLLFALLGVLFFLLGCTRELEEKLQGKEHELAETQTTLTKLKETMSTLEAAHTNQEEQLRRVERQRDKLTGQVTQLHTRLSETMAARDRETQQLSDLSREVGLLNAELTAAQAQAKRADEAMKRSEALHDQLGQAETAVAQKTADLQTAHSQMGELHQAVSQLEQQRQELEKRVSALNTDLRDTREQLIAAEAAKSGSTQQASALLAEVQQLQATLTESSKELGQLSARTARIPELENRIKTMNQERDKLRQELEQLAAEYTAARTRGEGVSSDLARAREDVEATRHALGQAEQRANQLKGQVDAMQKALVQAGAAREQAGVQLADLSAQRATLHTQLAAMTRLKGEADDRIAGLSSALATVQKDLIQTVEARDAAQNYVRDLTVKLGAAQKELETVSLARSDLEARASHLRRQLSTSTDHVLDLTEEVRRLRDQLRDEELSQLTTLPKTLTKGINFSHRRTALTTDAKDLLDRAVTILQNYPNVQLRIEGYTDSVGDKGFNRLLSEFRANAVRDYLMSRGVPPERLVAIGRGDDNPIASNGTPNGRFLNRRIEFQLNQMAHTGESPGLQPASRESTTPVQLEFRQPPKGR